MSASDADPVLVATDPVISHEVPVPVDGQILKDVSNLGSHETLESVAVGLVSLNKADAFNGAGGPTTSADEKENGPSHEQAEPASVEDGVFVDDKEVITHGSDIASETTKGVQDASVAEVDNAASHSITTDNLDDTTLNERDNEIKDIPNTSEVESIATVEHGRPADSDLTAPIANTTEPNMIDDSVNDSAIEILVPVLEKKQGCAETDEDDAAPADGVKLVETGNHNEAVQMDKRDATDNVDSTPEVMNQPPNGETLAIAEVALQEKGNITNVDVDIASSAAEGDALDIDAVPETRDENASIAMDEAPESNVTDSVVAQVDAADASVEPTASMKDDLSSDHLEPAAAASEVVVGIQEDEPKATVEVIVEQTQGGDAPAIAEEQVPEVEAAPTEANSKEDEVVIATETEIAVESNGAELTTEEAEQGGVDETSTEPSNNLDAEPLGEEVEVGHEVEPAAADVNNIEEAGSHEETVRSVVEKEPKVTEIAVRVIDAIPGTGANAVVGVDETNETVEEPTNDTEASISIPVEVKSISSEANIAHEVEVTSKEGRPVLEAEPVVANETIAAPVDARAEVKVDVSLEEVSAPVEGESVPASEELTAPVNASDAVHEATSVPVEEEVIPANAVITEPVIESEEVVPTAENVETFTPETTNDEASAKVEVEPVGTDEEVIIAPVDDPVTTEAVAEVSNEGGSVKVEPLPADEVITAPVIESEEVAQISDDIVAAAPETNVEAYEEAPATIEVENVTEEAKAVAEAEGVTETASEAETAGHDDVTETPGSVEPESIPASDEVAITVVEVAEEPVSTPIGLSEETFATTVNVENPASVDATDETTVVEGAPVEVPVDVIVAASHEVGHDVTGEAAPIVVAEDEVVAEETLAPVVETARAEDAPETIQEAPATPETGPKNPPPVVDVENADTSQGAESVPQTDEGASVPEIAPIEIAQEIVTESVDEEKERAVTDGELQAVTEAPAQDKEEEASAKAHEPEEEVVIEIQQPQPVSELGGKEVIDIGSTDVSAPVAEEIFTAAGQGNDVAVEESTSVPVVEVKENVPQLRTGITSIETSLDTTPFTPVLDSGIAFKEQEPAPSTLPSIAEEQLSWRPSSFQVSTVGGVESSGVGDAGPVSESAELAEMGEPASVPLLVVEDTPVNEQVSTIDASEDFVSVDQPSLKQPPRPWTTSYSVHSQGIAENFSSIDEPVPVHELQETATAVHELPLEEQGVLASIPVEGFTAEVINHNKVSEQVIEDVTSTAGSHVSSTEAADQVSEPALADLTEVSEEVTGGLGVAVGEEDTNEDVDQEANQEVEAKLTIDDTPARPWTPSYSTHSQGTPLEATKELEDVPPASVIADAALSAERNVENHTGNTVAVDDCEHDNTVDEQINMTENEANGQLSTEVSHASPVIALEGHKIEDETLNSQQSSQAEMDPNLENEVPPRPWTPSYAVHSQGSPAAVPKEVEEISSLDAESVEQSIPEPTAAQEITHSEPLTAEFDKSETEQSQDNNIGKIVAAAIAPAIALVALGAGSQGLVPVADEEVPQVDATLTVDTTAVPLLSIPSDVVDGDATDDALERRRSPWTPSYSVTKQGADLSQEEEAEVDHLEPLSPAAAQAAATSDSEPQLNEVEEADPASNALQTRPSYAVAGTEEMAKNEQFFLFGLRAIVAYLWVLPKWLTMTPSDHSRRGSSSSTSSSSSKFFPGGWFTPKPNEGSTSLDVAQGEFASSPKVTTSNDIFETLGSEATNSSAAVNVAAENDGQKRKWCVVM